MILQNIDKLTYAAILVVTGLVGWIAKNFKNQSLKNLFDSKSGKYLSIRRVAEIGIIHEMEKISRNENKDSKWLNHLVLFRLYRNGTDKLRTELHIKNSKSTNRTHSFLDNTPSAYYARFFEEVNQHGRIEISNTSDNRNFKRFSSFMLANDVQSCVVIKMGKEMYLLIASEDWRVYGKEIEKVKEKVMKLQEAINIIYSYRLN